MKTYRFGRWQTWDSSTEFYNIERKTIFGSWKEEKCWVVTRNYGNSKVMPDEAAKKLMMEAVDRLVRAGNTVI